MDSQQTFNKALLLLDKAKFDDAEQCLQAAINQAEMEKNTIVLISALVCYGELLSQLDRAGEANQSLRRALELGEAHADDLDDVVDHELDLARELLLKSGNG